MALLVDTQTVAPAERFEFWSDAASSVLHPLGLRHLAAQPFRGRMRRWQLGPVELFRIEGDASSISRTPATIALGDPEQLQVALLRRGRFLVTQAGRSARIDGGDIASYETSHPYSVAADREFDLLLFSVARANFGPRGDRMCRRTALAQPGRSGLGAVAAPFLLRIASGMANESVSPDDGDLAEATLDVIRALHSDREPATPGTAGLLGRIQAQMLAHLADPGLTPVRIAGEHYISVRLLHRLFAAEGTTVGQWLRERRLERCHRDLADPALRHLAAAEIASAWGFRSPSHFSRLFRAAYGCPPGEVRRRPRPSAGG